MAKKNIHPDYHEITVVLTDGTKFKTKSCSKETTIKLDVDPLNHSAWKEGGDRFINLKDNQVSKFNKRFGNISFGFTKKSAKTEQKPKETKTEDKSKESKKEEKPKETKEESKKEDKKE